MWFEPLRSDSSGGRARNRVRTGLWLDYLNKPVLLITSHRAGPLDPGPGFTC